MVRRVSFFVCRFSMLLVALFFAACGREDESSDGHGDQQVANQLVVDGITYPMTVTPVEDMSFWAVDAAGQHFVITGGVQHSEWGDDIDLTWDLTQPVEGIHFGFSFESSSFFYLVYENTGEKIVGVLDNTEYDGESMFYSGTAKVRYNSEGLVVIVSGTLKNGHSFAFSLSLPAQADQDDQLLPNEVIVGSTHHAVETSLSITNEWVYLFDVVGTDADEELSMILDIPLSMLGLKIQLYNRSGDDNYRIRFHSPVVDFSQQCSPGTSFAELNGTTLTSVFSQGAMIFSHDTSRDLFSVFINGRLVDGTPFGARLQVPVNEIRAMDYQAVLDGRPYQLDYTLTLQESVYTLFATGYENDAVLSSATLPLFNIRVSFPSSSLNRSFDLSESIHGVDYSIELTGEGLPFTPPIPLGFAKGTLHLEQDEMAISVNFTGVLSNGHSISMQAHVDNTQIAHGDRH